VGPNRLARPESPEIEDDAMTLSRRQFLHLVTSAAPLPATSRLAWAQTYPAQPVRIIVGTAAGGGVDIVARLMGQWLSERLGQQFVIENRPGAGGSVATEAAVRAPADGYTLLLINAANTISATLYEKLNYNFIRDIAPAASISREPLVMVVNPSFPAKTVAEFVAYTKANPGKVNMASPGNGTPSHMAGELFKMMTGTDMVHVPYRGGAPAVTDLLSRQVQLYFGIIGSSIEYIKAGTLRALGVTTASRSGALPDIPAIGEFVTGYEVNAWFGIGTPRNTPAGVLDKLNSEINTGLADPKLRGRLADLGGGAFSSSRAEFGKFIVDETEKWAKVIKLSGVKPD
jgi:tripartite-type tricarboxylate transporter receptor subunit TctC